MGDARSVRFFRRIYVRACKTISKERSAQKSFHKNARAFTVRLFRRLNMHAGLCRRGRMQAIIFIRLHVHVSLLRRARMHVRRNVRLCRNGHVYISLSRRTHTCL